MKSLDDVIDAMERCSKPHYFDCKGCPYEDDDAEVGCRSDDRDADVLNYLKMYRSDMIQWEADRRLWGEELSQRIREFDEAKNKLIAKFKELNVGTLNEPLTPDELFSYKLIGTPLWWEEKKEWLLVTDSALDNRSWIQLHDAYGKSILIEQQGSKKYSLYRTKPRKDNKGNG